MECNVFKVFYILQLMCLFKGQTITEIFTFSIPLNNTKTGGDLKMFIPNINEMECRIQCVHRFDCHSYDYHEQRRKCEINFNEGKPVKKATGWKHFKKERQKV